MNPLILAHAYLTGATIRTPQENRSPTNEEVLKAIREELNQQTEDRRHTYRARPDDHARNRRPTED